MNICIESMRGWFNAHPKTRQWVWFVALYLLGLGTVSLIAYPIKLLMKSI